MSDLFSSPEQPNVERRAAAPAAAPMTRAQSRNNPVARRRRRARRIRTTIIVVVTLALVGGAGFFVMKTVPGFFAKDSVSEDFAGPGAGEVQVQIAKGASGAAIGAALAEAGVIKTQAAFTQAIKDYTSANGSEPNLQYGTYNLMKEMSAAGALSAMLDKSNLVQDGVTVREGLTIAATVERLASVTAIPAADFEKALENPEALGLPAEADGNVEGWLAPARYPFTNDSTAEQILSTMIAKQVSDLNELGVSLKDANTVLTKASLVEAEAPADGRGKVARVIENRLDTDEALRFDSTIHYIAGERTSNATTTAEQRQVDSPYNTYKYTGLPPAPINSPGRASIEAVLEPEEGPWLFFVTTNPTTHETCYSITFAEHQVCVAQYQEWLRDNPVTSDPEGEE